MLISVIIKRKQDRETSVWIQKHWLTGNDYNVLEEKDYC